MPRHAFRLILSCALYAVVPIALLAQDFRIFNREIQVHGFASQAFVKTDENNWLTMNTADASAAFTDFGLNLSTHLTDKIFAGGQVYDRNLGQLGQYHPSPDWAVVDYHFRNWLGFRGGKVKTVLGLYNSTQDQDFLRPFALLPQSVYPTDLRDATIAHLGGDVYGNIALKHKLGAIDYTAFVGHRSDSIYSGYPYLLEQVGGVRFSSYGGLQYGGDLRWCTPLKGLLVGASRLNQNTTGKGKFYDPPFFPEVEPYSETSKADWTDQFFAEFTYGKLLVDSEYRRYVREENIFRNLPLSSFNVTDVRGWYIAGAYRILKRLQIGAYYSRYSITSVYGGVLGIVPPQLDTSLPANHIYDKVLSGRIDLNRFWNVKVEGHFMNGYGDSTYPDGFYPQLNPSGFKPDTNALIVRTSVYF